MSSGVERAPQGAEVGQDVATRPPPPSPEAVARPAELSAVAGNQAVVRLLRDEGRGSPDTGGHVAAAGVETYAGSSAPGVAGQLPGLLGAAGNRAVVRLLHDGNDGARDEATPGDASTAAAIRGRQGLGQPLDTPLREELSSGFGRELGAVQVHRDATADTLATSLGATAFTSGTDIFFRRGAYNPDSPSGYATIAHEIAHTFQQSAGPVPARAPLVVSRPGDPDERAAEAVADRVSAARGVPAAGPASPGPAPQRAPDAGAVIVGRQPAGAAPTTEPAADQDSPAAKVIDALIRRDDREQVLRACLAAGGQWNQVNELWRGRSYPVSLLQAALSLPQGSADAARVYAYLRFGRLRLADKLFLAGIGAFTDNETVFRLLPMIRSQLSATEADFTQSYSRDGDDAFGAEYTSTATLYDGTASAVAGFLDDEMSGADLIRATALLTFGELRPVDEVQIAVRSVHILAGDIMAAMDKVHRATPDGTKPPAENQYTQSYQANLRDVLGAELGDRSDNFRRVRMILDGDFTPLNRIRLACDAWVVDTAEIFTALTDATPAQLSELRRQWDAGGEVKKLIEDKLTISADEGRRVAALLRQGTSMDERLLQAGVEIDDTEAVVTTALEHPQVLSAFRAEYPQRGSFYSAFTADDRIVMATLWGNQLVSADWHDTLRLALQLDSEAGVLAVITTAVTTDELRAQVRGDPQVIGQLKDLGNWARIEPLIEPRDDLQARSQWLAVRFDREKGWWGGIASAAAYQDEKRELDAALATAADPAHLTDEERLRIAPLLGQAESALDTFIQVRDQLDAYAIQVLGIVAGLAVTALTGGAAGPMTASLLARVALAQACASVATVWAVKGERVTGGEAARAFAVGAASGAAGVLASGPVMSALSPAYAKAAATETAEVAAAVAQREFADTGLSTLKNAFEGAAGGAAGSAMDAGTRSETWRQGFLSGLSATFEHAALGGAQGAATGAAFEAVRGTLFGSAATPGAGGQGGPGGAVADAAMVARARQILELGDAITWQRWNSEILPSFGADEAAARQALGLARQAILRDLVARVQPQLEPLGVVAEAPVTAHFDGAAEITVRPAGSGDAAATEAALTQAVAAIQREVSATAAGRLGTEVAAGGVRGTDVYQMGTEAMTPLQLDKAIQRQVLGDGNWAAPGTKAVRADVNQLTLTVPAEATGAAAHTIEVAVNLVDSAGLPGGAHPSAGGSEAGSARVRLVPPTPPKVEWTATIWVDSALLPENVRFVVGHELDEIAITVRRLAPSGTATEADVAAQALAGIFTRTPAANAQPTAHDIAHAVELFEVHQQQMEMVKSLRRAAGKPEAEGFAGKARRHTESLERLLHWMALDDPTNMDAKLRVLQQQGSGGEWAEFIEVLREVGGSAAHAQLAAATAPAGRAPIVDAALLGHLMFPVGRSGGQFTAKGIDGGHSDPALHALVDQPGSVLRVVEEGQRTAGGNVFRRYAQYEWTGTGPAPAVGDPAAPAPGAPTPAGWRRSTQWKTTAQDFPTFIATADAALAGYGPLPGQGTITLTTADNVPIVVLVRDGVVKTVFIDESWF